MAKAPGSLNLLHFTERDVLGFSAFESDVEGVEGDGGEEEGRRGGWDSVAFPRVENWLKKRCWPGLKMAHTT